MKKTGRNTIGTVTEVLDDYESEQIVVRYETENGSYSVSSSSGGMGGKSKIGDNVRILYSKEHPSNAIIVADLYSKIILIGILIFVFGGIAVYLALKH